MMKEVQLQADWPESWKASFQFDQQEVWGRITHHGYASAYASRFAHTLGLVRRYVAPGSSLLDVAAAQGNFSLALAEMGYDVTWNDLRADLVEYVRLKCDRQQLCFAPGNIVDLSFPAGFDAVLAGEVIEHVAHPDQFLKVLAGLVKPGGHLVLTTPNGQYIRNKLPKFSDCHDPAAFEACQFKPDAAGHIFLLHPDELRRLGSEAGLDLLALEFLNNPLTCGHLKSENLLRFLPMRVVRAMEWSTRRLPEIVQSRLMVHLTAVFRRPISPHALNFSDPDSPEKR